MKGRPLPRIGGADFLAYWTGEAWRDGLDLLTYQALKALPAEWVSAFGARLASAQGPTVYRDEHERARANAARLRPDLDEEALLRRWEGIGRLMAEYAKLGAIRRSGRVAVEGLDALKAAYAQERGVVAIVLHLGNWEVLPGVVRDADIDTLTFYEPRPTRAHDHITRTARARTIGLLPPGLAGVRPAMRALQAGRLVAIFGDEEVDGVVRAPLFGRPPTIVGNLAHAARFARHADAPVFVAYAIREEGARFRVHFLGPVALPPGRDLAEDVARLNAVIEPVVLDHLDQWYFLHERLD